MSQSLTLSPPAATVLPDSPVQETNELSSFRKFIQKKATRKLIVITGLGVLIQFVVFKLLYPYPDFFSDSYSYLFAAYAHLDVSIWPIGYSKFLLLFHYLTPSSLALIGFQYFFLELGALCFFISFLYIYQPAKTARVLFYLFLFFNPLLFYISNYVNSDPLFVALSLFWFTQLLWILHKPRLYQVLIQALLLFLCFTVRNNAYYYPVISALTFLLSKLNWKAKLTAILMPFAFIIPFIIHTQNVAYQMTGSKQYSLFTGWQLANNALYIYPHIQVDNNLLLTKESQQLDHSVKSFYQSIPKGFPLDAVLSSYVGNFFIREPKAPLKVFLNDHYTITDEYDGIIAWGKASSIYAEYGTSIIKNNPVAYLKYFCVLNAKNYILPPLEKLEVYNLGLNKIDPIAEFWFHYSNNKIISIPNKIQGIVLYVFPILFMILNFYLLLGIVMTLLTRKYKSLSPTHFKTGVLLSAFYLLNVAFSVLVTINVFRYQVFPMILCILLSILISQSLRTIPQKL